MPIRHSQLYLRIKYDTFIAQVLEWRYWPSLPPQWMEKAFGSSSPSIPFWCFYSLSHNRILSLLDQRPSQRLIRKQLTDSISNQEMVVIGKKTALQKPISTRLNQQKYKPTLLTIIGIGVQILLLAQFGWENLCLPFHWCLYKSSPSSPSRTTTINYEPSRRTTNQKQDMWSFIMR